MEREKRKQLVASIKDTLAEFGAMWEEDNECKNPSANKIATCIEQWLELNKKLVCGKKYTLTELEGMFGKVKKEDDGLYLIRFKNIGVQWNEDYIEDATQLSTVVSVHNDKGKEICPWLELDDFDINLLTGELSN